MTKPIAKALSPKPFKKRPAKEIEEANRRGDLASAIKWAKDGRILNPIEEATWRYLIDKEKIKEKLQAYIATGKGEPGFLKSRYELAKLFFDALHRGDHAAIMDIARTVKYFQPNQTVDEYRLKLAVLSRAAAIGGKEKPVSEYASFVGDSDIAGGYSRTRQTCKKMGIPLATDKHSTSQKLPRKTSK